MRIHRFFIDQTIQDKEVLIQDERLVHQWRNVFRYNVGSEVVLFDGSGFEYKCVIKFLSNREANLEIMSKKESVIPNAKITLYQSLIKKDNFEWIAEKVTELGVAKIVPIVSERSEKKNINEERLRKILIEASEQCGRGDVPELGQIVELGEALESAQNIIIFDREGAVEESTFGVASIFIGPEGGWSEKEKELFKQKSAKVYSLGPLTLRAETAAIVAVSRFTPPA